MSILHVVVKCRTTKEENIIGMAAKWISWLRISTKNQTRTRIYEKRETATAIIVVNLYRISQAEILNWRMLKKHYRMQPFESA